VRTSSALAEEQSAMTVAPRRLASWTAADPTPPEAPVISTVYFPDQEASVSLTLSNPFAPPVPVACPTDFEYQPTRVLISVRAVLKLVEASMAVEQHRMHGAGQRHTSLLVLSARQGELAGRR
jgi:hypothetical protein